MAENNTSIAEMEKIARQIRGRVVEMSYHSRASHLGSALSCVDILVALYWGAGNLDKHIITTPLRDRVILSKGHAIASLYAVLAFKGIIDDKLLESFCSPGSRLEEHPGPHSPKGVEAATGSLGHGLSLGAGMALAGRINRQDYDTYVLSSDGESNEGSVWEAAMMAAARKLNRLCVIVDYNKWQATGRSRDIMAIEPLCDKWKAFGWKAVEVDGHDMKTLVNVLSKTKEGRDKPLAVIAHTIKGKGISFMEDDNNWHYKVPSATDVEKALKELKIEK
ncbi:MAG: transketolase [Desulfobacula sp.]|jgi:transketolase